MSCTPIPSQNPALPLGSLPVSALEAFQGAVLGAILGEQGLCAPGPSSPQHNHSDDRSQFPGDAQPEAAAVASPTLSPYVHWLGQALQGYGDPGHGDSARLTTLSQPSSLPFLGLDQDILRTALAQALAYTDRGCLKPQSAPQQLDLGVTTNPALILALDCLRTSPSSWLLTVHRCWWLSDRTAQGSGDLETPIDRPLAVTLAATLSGFALGSRAIPLALQDRLAPPLHRSALHLAQTCFQTWAGTGATAGDPSLLHLSLSMRSLGVQQ